MVSLPISRLLASAFLLPLISGCFPVVDRTLRVTLAVQENNVVYQGTGIQQIVCYSAVPFLKGMSTGGCHTAGEAVFVTVGKHGPLFMPLTIHYEEAISKGRAAGMPRPTKWTIPMDIDEMKMPALYRFTDVTNVKTLESVDPNSLSTSFGPGVQFHSITVEQIKYGRVTRGEVIKQLPWLKDYYLPGGGTASFQSKNVELFNGWQGDVRPSYFLGSK